MTDEPTEPSDPDQEPAMRDDTTPDEPKENIVHFNPWRDFNDAAPQIDVFGDEPDPAQLAQFMQVVFGYCDGLIPVRSFIDKGQGIDGRPHNIWLEADHSAPEKMATFATWASREGAAVYVIPGTVAAPGQAKATDILQMQTVVVDLDTGDIAAKRAHLERHLGAASMVVESGGVTAEGQRKCHVWWALTEPAEGDDIARVCRLRGDIAAKVGGDMHFRSAHQPIRVAGSVYYKNNLKTQVRIVELSADRERDLAEFIKAVTDMPPAPGVSLQPTVLPGLSAAPSPPPTGKASVYARNRAGAPWIDVMRPSGRDFPLQPHFGVNRIATWSPSVTTTITTEGLPITSVGTVSHPTLAATNLAASMRRWRLTSAAVVDSVADQRSAGWACWRGNAAGLGGWTFVTRISLTTLQATGMGFFGLYGSTAALATTLTLAAAINCIGIGFQRGTHTRWQLVANDGTGAPTLTDMGASFGIATGGVLTLFIAAPPNGGSVWVRVVDEVSGAVFEQEITADLPAATQFLSPRLFLNTGATAAAVAYDCAGVYLETDF